MSPIRTVLLILLVVLAAVAFRLRGGTRPVAPVQGAVVLTAADGRGVYWVERAGEGAASLYGATRLGPPGRLIASAPDIRSIATAREAIFYLTEDKQPNSGQLWQRDRRGTGPRSLLQGLRAPQGLLATRDRLYWAETRPSPAPGIPCVPVLQPLSMIYGTDLTGQGRQLLAVTENVDLHFAGKLLGEREGKFYWLQHIGVPYNRPMMVVSAVPTQGGAPTELLRTRGLQDAALTERQLYFTAASREMAVPLAARSVWAMPLPGGEAEALTDWMNPTGLLLRLGNRMCYADGRYVWRLPAQLEEAEVVAPLKVDWRTAALGGGAAYGWAAETTPRRLVRCPLTFGARLRGIPGLL